MGLQNVRRFALAGWENYWTRFARCLGGLQFNVGIMFSLFLDDTIHFIITLIVTDTDTIALTK